MFKVLQYANRQTSGHVNNWTLEASRILGLILFSSWYLTIYPHFYHIKKDKHFLPCWENEIGNTLENCLRVQYYNTEHMDSRCNSKYSNPLFLKNVTNFFFILPLYILSHIIIPYFFFTFNRHRCCWNTGDKWGYKLQKEQRVQMKFSFLPAWENAVLRMGKHPARCSVCLRTARAHCSWQAKE